MATEGAVCFNCKIREGHKRCSRCKVVTYCGRECQIADWKNGHNIRCSSKLKSAENRVAKEKSSDYTQKEIPQSKAEVPNDTSQHTVSYRTKCCNCLERSATFSCGRCRILLYCSKKCQVKDWTIHKNRCTPFQQQQKKRTDKNPKEDAISFQTLKNSFGSMFSIDVPDFHLEYKTYYPKETGHFQILQSKYYEQKSNFILEYKMVETPWDRFIFLRRYGEESDEVYEFLCNNPALGDIFSSNRIPQTDPFHVYIFRNIDVKERAFEFGKTYVFVGFLDMLQLMFGNFEGGGDKVRFVGYERSKVCVARSLVIYEMIKMKTDHLSILQVWFSSGWSNQTLNDFNCACKKVIREVEIMSVKELIGHWMKINISVNEARKVWQNMKYSYEAAVNLKNEQDRVQFCRYSLTGQIFGNLDLQCYGNVTMFFRPSQKLLLIDDSVLYSFSYKNRFCYDGNFFRSFEAFYKSKLEAFAKVVQDGKVECKFYVMDVNLENKSGIEKIRSLQPHCIDWSNIPDYTKKETFFHLAESCSTKKTIHYVHFMNWIKTVFGTFILEYPVGERLKIYLEQKKKFQQIFETLHEKNLIPFLRKDKYVGHPWDMSSAILAMKYWNRFLRYYFNVPGFVIKNKDVSKPGLCGGFQRTSNVYALTFTIAKPILKQDNNTKCK